LCGTIVETTDFLAGENKAQENKDWKKRIASGFISLPGREAEYGTTCSGLVHWCVCTLAAAGTCRTNLASYSVGVQSSTQAAAHTLEGKALEFSSQRKRQQERTYHPNNHTRVQTQGLSQSSSALLPPLVC